MCCCCKNITEKVSKYIVEFNSPSSFLDVKIGDIANILIAVLTIGLSFYVFVYQRKKDKADQLNFLQQSILSTRLEMYKILIIEPNISNLYTLIDSISATIQTLNGVTITPAIKTSTINTLDISFNDFESKFIDLLGAINSNHYNQMLNLYDIMRDDISDRINQLPNTAISPLDDISNSFSINKNNFINAIYKFDNVVD
jgi:hypothetical protein